MEGVNYLGLVERINLLYIAYRIGVRVGFGSVEYLYTELHGKHGFTRIVILGARGWLD